MTYQEFQRHVGKAGLTLGEFAELIRMNRVSLSNLSKKGEVPSHLAVIACLLGELGERNIEFRTIIAAIGLEPKKPRGAAAKGRFGGNPQADFFARPSRGRPAPPLATPREHNKNT